MHDQYQSGFGNYFRTEAVAGALPEGRNSPQRAPLGLYAELLSGNSFTAPRSDNRRTWVYRIRPSAAHNASCRRIEDKLLRSAPLSDTEATPSQLRWDPFPMPSAATDFLDGLTTLGANGDATLHVGCAIHAYTANRSMVRRAFYNADGEMLIVPQQGALRLVTELGRLDVAPGEIVVVPRGLRFLVELIEDRARGYVCENYGTMFKLPELGPLGSNGLANPRDFWAPIAAYEEDNAPYTLTAKFGGHLWQSVTRGYPFDVVAWHGNLAPYKYDLAHFMVVGSISFDHPDPSIYTVLTSPSETPGTANVDFVIFPPRWLVAENTFRPPWYHRNVMSEFMGLLYGVYDSKAEGFLPGGASLHNCWSAHGPDATTFSRASSATLAPHKLDHTMAFMFESKFVIHPTAAALGAAGLQQNYVDCWRDLEPHFSTPRSI